MSATALISLMHTHIHAPKHAYARTFTHPKYLVSVHPYNLLHMHMQEDCWLCLST